MKSKFIPKVAHLILIIFGAMVEVLEPEKLRKSMVAELRLALGGYEYNNNNKKIYHEAKYMEET